VGGWWREGGGGRRWCEGGGTAGRPQLLTSLLMKRKRSTFQSSRGRGRLPLLSHPPLLAAGATAVGNELRSSSRRGARLGGMKCVAATLDLQQRFVTRCFLATQPRYLSAFNPNPGLSPIMTLTLNLPF
jgi:hypothetical protein